ncbi:DUF4395 domain-containing protein [Dictyobacter aurantiacus]|uniref:DUF4395 domain-containing protein n=1 Tax=Dictyobacter aurantiacus TaxID=1936993 RepID=A0A401ZQ05_9CHLR|nr:DUF4395 domain-containing protein [Dictyobacter aurantiacus]GCE08988.1 hypothetical protein KDAU_63170 [Dictyobacter aurantiacus]
MVAVPRVDAHMLKFSQSCVLVLTALSFLFNLPILVLISGLALALSAILPAASPFRLIYRQVIVRAGLLKPRMVEDDPAPHRFAQGVGATFLLAASILFFLTSATLAGWILTIIVFVLAAINVFVGFCAGCFVYYYLGRWGLMPRVRYDGGFRWRGV